jgi:hypothetical protein
LREEANRGPIGCEGGLWHEGDRARPGKGGEVLRFHRGQSGIKAAIPAIFDSEVDRREAANGRS